MEVQRRKSRRRRREARLKREDGWRVLGVTSVGEEVYDRATWRGISSNIEWK